MKFQRGKKDVTTAGTPVALDTNRYVQSLTIKARENNTGRVFPGASDVTNADAQQGLNPGDSLTLAWPQGARGNLADIFIDAAVNAEGVVFWYLAA